MRSSPDKAPFEPELPIDTANKLGAGKRGRRRVGVPEGETPIKSRPQDAVRGNGFAFVEKVEADASATTAKARFFRGDAVEWLRSLPSEVVDLVITDPPYESLEKHRAVGTTTRLKHSKSSSNDWFSIFPNARFPELFAELYRVLRRDRHLYLFCDAETAFVAKPAGEAAGFKFWKPLVWDKVSIGMGYHYRARYEFVLFFEKGKRKVADLGVPDIIRAARVRNGYPTEKPVEVSSLLVSQSTVAGEIVCDPFAGSGSVGVAAVTAGRSFWGADTTESALMTMRSRVLKAGAVLDADSLRSLEVQAS